MNLSNETWRGRRRWLERIVKWFGGETSSPAPDHEGQLEHDARKVRGEINRVQTILGEHMSAIVLERATALFRKYHEKEHGALPTQEDVALILRRTELVLEQFEYDEKTGRAMSLIQEMFAWEHISITGELAPDKLVWYFNHQLERYRSIDEYLLEDLLALWRNPEFVTALNRAIGCHGFTNPFPTLSTKN